MSNPATWDDVEPDFVLLWKTVARWEEPPHGESRSLLRYADGSVQVWHFFWDDMVWYSRRHASGVHYNVTENVGSRLPRFTEMVWAPGVWENVPDTFLERYLSCNL
jgi:hypothetical protein